MTPLEQILKLQADRKSDRSLIASLQAQLISLGITPKDVPPAWAEGLRPGDVCLMSVLADAYPRSVTVWDLEDALPKRDHTKDRDISIVRVRVNSLREWFGKDAIKTVRGQGYRCSKEFFERTKSQEIALAA